VSELTELEARMKRFEDVEAIKRLKHKYFRCLDQKRWEELGECFTEDAVSSYHGGRYKFVGRDKILEFLSKSLTSRRIGMHQGHHPEIDLTSDATATGIWEAEAYLIDLKENTSLHEVTFYQDEYVKVNGQWKIKSTGYTNVFEETCSRTDIQSLKLTENMFRRPE
jgi:bile-acid 7alpha-dehydratase